MRRVLVLRARQDAESTARALQAAGFEPILSPALEIVPTHAALPEGPFDAVLATSANALRRLPPPPSKAPLHVVGARTAALSRSLGWRVDIVAADAAELARRLRARHAGAPARLLYLAGHDRRAALEQGLRGAGHDVEVCLRYEAVAATALAPAAREAIQNAGIFAATHFSRRSVEIFLRLLMQEGLSDHLAEMRHVVISEFVAEPLRALACDAHVAKSADLESVLAALSALARGADEHAENCNKKRDDRL